MDFTRTLRVSISSCCNMRDSAKEKELRVLCSLDLAENSASNMAFESLGRSSLNCTEAQSAESRPSSKVDATSLQTSESEGSSREVASSSRRVRDFLSSLTASKTASATLVAKGFLAGPVRNMVYDPWAGIFLVFIQPAAWANCMKAVCALSLGKSTVSLGTLSSLTEASG